MRSHLLVGVVVLGTTALANSPRLLADPKADAVMADARKALGGEKKLTDLKSLSLRAEFRREMASMGPAGAGGGSTVIMMAGPGGAAADGQIGGSIQIDLLLPDRFYREETSTGGLSITRIDGFDGNRPFLQLASNNPGTRVSADNPASDPERAKAALRRTNADLGRLLLGLVAGTQPGLPVSYAYAGEAESPDGKAHVIDVTGPDEFKARLFIDTTTHLPLMLTYVEAEARPVRLMQRRGTGSEGTRVATPGGGATRTGGQGAPELTAEQRAEIDKQMKEAAATPPKMVEYRMFFSEYREVSGISLPHRITRGTAEKTTEEWDIKDYKVNPALKVDRFKVGTD